MSYQIKNIPNLIKFDGTKEYVFDHPNNVYNATSNSLPSFFDINFEIIK